MSETVPADIAAAIDALERLQQVWGRAMEGGSYRGAGTAAREARAALDAAILKHLHRTEALCELARNDADLIGIA